MISHANLNISGTHESPVHQAPMNHSIRTKFAGVNGESEIRLGRGGRLITCRIMLHGGYSAFGELNSVLSELDHHVNEFGDLVFSRGAYGGLDRTYQACTFQGFEKDADPDSGPLPDLTGLLDGTPGSFWVRGTLTWYQLATEPQSASGN